MSEKTLPDRVKKYFVLSRNIALVTGGTIAILYIAVMMIMFFGPM
jgi:hypothetical protein